MIYKRTDDRTVIAALVGLLLGVLLLVLGANLEVPWASVLALNVGSFLIASVVMALIFEWWQLRGLLDDLAKHVRGIEQIKHAGITGFAIQFHDNVPWEELFQESNRLDMMVAYASTWRNNHQNRLERFLEDPDAELEVILPDPGFVIGIAELASRFECSAEELTRKIQDAHDFFEYLGMHAKGRVRIYDIRRAPTFTFYRFNTRAVFTTYRHRPGRGSIVTLIADRGGKLYDWLRSEWYGMVKDGALTGLTVLKYSNREGDVPLTAQTDLTAR